MHKKVRLCSTSGPPILCGIIWWQSRFSVIVARRVYRKIGDYILKQKNIDNYNKAGKIYVPMFEKVIQTFLSIFDFVKLLFIENLKYDNQTNHNILEQEINLNERI